MIQAGFQGWERLKRDLAILRLTEKKKKRLLSALVNVTLRENRTRIRKQENLDGSKMPSRKRGKKKVLTKALRGNTIRKRWRGDQVTLTPHQIWKKHHLGEPVRGKRDTASRKYTQLPCTKEQALALRQEVKRFKNRPVPWLRARFTRGQAGYFLNQARGQVAATRDSWSIPMPERHALGINQQTRLAAQRELTRQLRLLT